jgi:dipeptidyl aminopeptidase/acylaminoacyl peptidase
MDREVGPESCFALDDVQGFVVSPDGKTVVALTPWKSNQPRTALHFIDVASSVITNVVLVPRLVEIRAGIAWTADGSRIIYATRGSFTSALESYRIADGAIEMVAEPAEGDIWHIAVSPDSRYAMFERESVSSDAVLLTVTP